MLTRLFLTSFSIIFGLYTFTQPLNPSIHTEQLKKYNQIGTHNAKFWQAYWNHKKLGIKISPDCQLQKLVFGWHPYWSNGLEDNYQWHLLSDLAYFAYEFDPNTGQPTNTHNWFSANVIDEAKENNVRVHLTVILFSNHEAFFSSTQAQETLINNLIEAISIRDADGINLDFEAMPSTCRDQFTEFVRKLREALDRKNPQLLLSIALPAVDWYNVFDIQALNQYVDLFIIMGYEYYWSGSNEAGPSGQLYTLSNFNYTQARSIIDYLNRGVPQAKLLLGVPYYGRKWQTQNNNIPSQTLSRGSVVLIKNMYQDYPNRLMNLRSRSEYVIYKSENQWYQVWVDCDSAMTYKYQVVNQIGIAGIGIWALGYDDGYLQMWQKITDYFTDCAKGCNDTIWDLGGPMNNYWNNESYTYSFSAEKLHFDYVSLAPEDILRIYDGDRLLTELSGENENLTYQSVRGYFNLEFNADGSFNSLGWQARVIKQNLPDTSVIYPIPASNYLKTHLPKGYYFLITDIKGNILRKGVLKNDLFIGDLPTGIYIFKYFKPNPIVQKFIKL